ncbi:MAG: hypothetical protein F6K54_24160 [Okeania sp. SIO3B5]|uniref:hypothetical protein n=1 Tax=Okeania sp. SIO3B5 TaxID=2607811 RepID=UPI001400F920|nr:hypothetical protein [Okeania sp. SIO3B5]NEO55888.1 hypothetical protein [Okeania sp. SIO3B5]
MLNHLSKQPLYSYQLTVISYQGFQLTVISHLMTSQGLKLLANSLSYLKMTLLKL